MRSTQQLTVRSFSPCPHPWVQRQQPRHHRQHWQCTAWHTYMPHAGLDPHLSQCVKDSLPTHHKPTSCPQVAGCGFQTAPDLCGHCRLSIRGGAALTEGRRLPRGQMCPYSSTKSEHASGCHAPCLKPKAVPCTHRRGSAPSPDRHNPTAMSSPSHTLPNWQDIST